MVSMVSMGVQAVVHMSYNYHSSNMRYPSFTFSHRKFLGVETLLCANHPPRQSNMWPFSIFSRAPRANNPAIDPLADLVQGYPKLAGRMALDPDMQMFCSFGALNMRNLLYLQNDLVYIES
jgi:hypothetical protein